MPDDGEPILTIASLTPNEKPTKENPSPFKQISIELYKPLPGGLSFGGTFAPEKMKRPAAKERRPRSSLPAHDTPRRRGGFVSWKTTSDSNRPSLAPIAVVRRRARPDQFARVVPEACGLVWEALRKRGTGGAGRHVAFYLDGEINLEVGVEMSAPFAGEGEVIASTTPGGPVATATHFGPYGGLGAAHEAIRRWCTDRGYALAGPNWEIYGHWTDACDRDPSAIRTDVYYLLKASSLQTARRRLG